MRFIFIFLLAGFMMIEGWGAIVLDESRPGAEAELLLRAEAERFKAEREKVKQEQLAETRLENPTVVQTQGVTQSVSVPAESEGIPWKGYVTDFILLTVVIGLFRWFIKTRSE